jgi:hypothetical protein
MKHVLQQQQSLDGSEFYITIFDDTTNEVTLLIAIDKRALTTTKKIK